MSIIVGNASGNNTLRIICIGEAPIACAASITPLLISRIDVSTKRARNGIAAIVSGTQAAVVPMEEPAIIRVSGIIATIKMINGMERSAFTTEPNVAFTALFSKIWPLPVITKITPNGMPTIMDTTVEIIVICKVSPKP